MRLAHRILHRRLRYPELGGDLAEGEALAVESVAFGPLIVGERSAVELHARVAKDLTDGALAQAVDGLEVAGLDATLLVGDKGSPPLRVKPHVQTVGAGLV